MKLLSKTSRGSQGRTCYQVKKFGIYGSKGDFNQFQAIVAFLHHHKR